MPLNGLWQWLCAIPDGVIAAGLFLVFVGYLYLDARYGGLLAWLDGAMPDSDESVVFRRAASQFRQNPTTFDKPRSP